MYPELGDETDIISVLESCVRKLGYIDKFTSDSLIDLKNLSKLLEELGLHPSKRQVMYVKPKICIIQPFFIYFANI